MTSVFFAMVFAGLSGAQDLADYEGVASDSFAAWSFTSGSVAVAGDTRTTSVMARYVTPLPVENSTRTVAYSIHEIRFHCTERNSDWSAGENYTADGASLGAGRASTAEPWSASTPGYIELATQVCALDGSL